MSLFSFSPRRLAAFGIIGLSTFVGAAQGAVIAIYEFDGTSTAASDVPTGITASTFDHVGFTSVSNDARNVGSASGVNARGGTGMNTFSNETNHNSKYWFFTLTPAPGYTLNITGFSFNYERDAGNSASSWRMRTSLNSYASNTVGPRSLTGIDTDQSDSVALSLTNITSPITIRFSTTQAGGSNDRLFIDDVQVIGTVVPEPSALALLGLGALPMLRRRREV